MLQRTHLMWLLMAVSLLGCESPPYGTTGPPSGVLHLNVGNEMDGPSGATTRPVALGAVRLRILIDGVQRIDGVYCSSGVYFPAQFQFELSTTPHSITVEVPGKARCTFGVATINPVWAAVLFSNDFGNKTWASYETADHQLRQF